MSRPFPSFKHRRVPDLPSLFIADTSLFLLACKFPRPFGFCSDSQSLSMLFHQIPNLRDPVVVRLPDGFTTARTITTTTSL